MDTSKLTARLHDILRGETRPAQSVSASDPGGHGGGRRSLPSTEATRQALGAERWEVDGADCLVVRRRYPPEARHGILTVGEYAGAAARHLRGVDLLGGSAERLMGEAEAGTSGLDRLLFFDLETTGLAGGTGTYAFLVGCGGFSGDAFETRQLFLADQADERYLLEAVTTCVESMAGVVTFNGRAFDLPLVALRYGMNRRRSPFEDLPHIDLLHPARRLWRRRQPSACDPREAGYASCALGALEQAILEVVRIADVPGAEIPGRYFQYVRTGDVSPLIDVFEHNRLDLLSLAALTAVVLQMLEGGADVARNPRECVALGRVFEQTGQIDRAKHCYARAASLAAGAPGNLWDRDRLAEAEALRALARHLRRERRFDEAAVLWERILDGPPGDATIEIEAMQALAIHHEHRMRDLERARALTLHAIARESRPRLKAEHQRRLDRLHRKIGGR